MSVRAASAAATRLRILRAACDVYAREGFRAASIQAVAREADVSPATVLNHFETSDELLVAALALISSELGLPDPGDIAALATPKQRITRLVREVIGVYQRTGQWSEVYFRDRDMPAVRKAADAFFRRVEALVRAALGAPLADKRRVAVVLALIGPANVFGLRASGMSLADAADTMAEVIVSWVTARKGSKK
jgi:AcrR family transcriptional regulator